MNLLITLYSDPYQNENENRNTFKDITWSPYDRITFKNVGSFEQLCSDNDSALISNKKDAMNTSDKGNTAIWNGIKQCMHLIEVGSDSSNKEWIIGSNDAQYIFYTEKKEYNFFCIYAIRFSDIVQRLIYNGKVFDKNGIREKVYDFLKSECTQRSVEFKSFRSLGSEDMVVILLANSLKDIIFVVDQINKTTIILPNNVREDCQDKSKLLSTVCVFSGFNNRKHDAETDVDLIIRLNLKENNISEILEELNRHIKPGYTQQPIFCGISAVQLSIPAGKIRFQEFQEDGIFNGSSQFYTNNIYSSRTYFSIATDHQKNDYNIDLSSMYGLSLLDKNKCNYSSGLKISPVADFLFGEYCRLLDGQRTVQWNSILKEQYESTKSFVAYYSKVDKFIECELLNYMQSALHLINQTCSPVSEIPKHNHFYAGSFHDLLKAYYGIIDMLFDIGYGLPHGGKTSQHPITFAICLNSTARIESRMFIRPDIKHRIVIFFLPYDTFWNYSDNIKQLVHEVFHYIAPYDRKNRAKSMVNLLYSRIVNQLIVNAAAGSSKYKNEVLTQYIHNWVYFMVEKFDIKASELLCKDLERHFTEFFFLSNPEWKNRFINRFEILNVILFIENKVKEDIISSYDSAIAYMDQMREKGFDSAKNVFDKQMVYNCLQKRELSKNEKSFIDTYLDKEKINQGIVGYLNTCMLAVKEAFCDIWAIKITGMSIVEYIVFLIKTMRKSYTDYNIKVSLSKSDATETSINFPSILIRMTLLIYKHLNEIGSEDVSNIQSNKIFKGLYDTKTEEGKFISECIKIIAQKYIQFVGALGKYEINELCNMTFYMVDNIFMEIEKYDPQKRIEILKRISRTNLKYNIDMSDIDELANFIGVQKIFSPKKVSNENGFSKSTSISHEMSYSRIISNVGELMDSIRAISNIILTDSKNGHRLWYRGVCSANFSLLPSIFRNGDRTLSIYANQANMIKSAYFNAPYASDVWNLPIEQKTACLQHYGIPTNLLDFSLNPLVSLYFSIIPDREDDRIRVENGEYQPVIYVFDPMTYSRAIRRMAEGKMDLSIPDTISSVTFDINQNEEEKSKYFVSDMSYNYLYEHNSKYSDVYVPDDRGDPYPAPIVVQQSNPRIVAQSGTFVAYSLHAKPQTENLDKRYDYLDLLTIQQRYLEFLNNSTNQTDRFIFPIYLRKEYIFDLRASLKQLNINTGKFYPELSKIFGDAMSDMSKI